MRTLQIDAGPVSEDVEVISEAERKRLEEFGAGLASMNLLVNTMTGVRRGIVVRAFENETKRLEHERYGDAGR